jgi:hypothetical protein
VQHGTSVRLDAADATTTGDGRRTIQWYRWIRLIGCSRLCQLGGINTSEDGEMADSKRLFTDDSMLAIAVRRRQDL